MKPQRQPTKRISDVQPNSITELLDHVTCKQRQLEIMANNNNINITNNETVLTMQCFLNELRRCAILLSHVVVKDEEMLVGWMNTLCTVARDIRAYPMTLWKQAKSTWSLANAKPLHHLQLLHYSLSGFHELINVLNETPSTHHHDLLEDSLTYQKLIEHHSQAVVGMVKDATDKHFTTKSIQSLQSTMKQNAQLVAQDLGQMESDDTGHLESCSNVLLKVVVENRQDAGTLSTADLVLESHALMLTI